jgi:YegS/Rv2252/BmrU family lipid kinase
MSHKLIFLINPISGNGDKTAVQKVIRQRCKDKGIDYEILHTAADGNYDWLKKKIEAEKIRAVVVVGGDGTVSAVAAALSGVHMNIGIIPRGSGNGLAYAARIPKDISKALDIIFAGKHTTVDAFKINDEFSCMLSGLGFDAQVAHDFSKQSKRGLATYVKVTATDFFKARPYAFSIDFNNSILETHAYFISIANSNQFGNQFTIAPKASLSDGLLDIVIVPKMSKIQMLYSVLYHIRFGKIEATELSKKGILYFQTDQLTIHNPELAPLHIDGDPKATDQKFDITVIPGAFRLIHP